MDDQITLRKETNLYDDQAVANAISNVDKKVSATYGTCSTTADTAAKVVTLEDFTLFRGAQISVFFSYANTVASPTLNVNGTGAKAIWARGAAIVAQYYWSANSTHTFTYDGTNWVMENAESQEEVYKRLTNNGQNTGLYLENGSLYMNATYIHSGTLSADYIYGGTLTLGGANNVNGYCIVKDSSGNEVIRINNSGIIMKNNTLSKRVEMNNVGLSFFDSLDDQTKVMDVTCNPASGSSVRGIKFYKNYLFIIGKGSDSGDVGQMAFDTSVLALQHYTKVSLRINGTDYSFQKAGMTAGSGYISAKQFKTHEILLDSGSQLAIGTSSNSVWVKGAFTASGTKSRSATTKDYGERLLYCYETPSPVFGDIGEGVISDDGKCYVWIDNIFAETVTLNQYQVFLQKYGDGDCWVSAKTPVYFVVEGTPNMSFGWEIKAKQSDFDQLRLVKNVGDFEIRNSMDYAEDLISHIEDIRSEREVNAA